MANAGLTLGDAALLPLSRRNMSFEFKLRLALTRKKTGFGVPLMDWLARLRYPGDRDFGLGIDLALVHRWNEAHRRRKADHRLFLWIWQVLQHRAA
ncbi:MAG TPA: hypothetical protein VE397_22210 [Stellaceae bacterium]|nr:hypothetical protein [Stellaceae bacterium]